jgi:hypothetical protein
MRRSTGRTSRRCLPPGEQRWSAGLGPRRRLQDRALLRLRQHVPIRRSDHPILIEEPLVHQRRGEPSQAQLVRIAPRPRITKQDAEGNRRRSDEARRPRVRRRSPGVAAAERKRQRVGGRRSSSPVQPPISIGASGPACGREPRWCRRTMWRMNGGAIVDSVSAGARPASGGATSGSENSPSSGASHPGKNDASANAIVRGSPADMRQIGPGPVCGCFTEP